MTEPSTLRIHRFEAENFKRIKVVEITPDGAVVIIGGRNSQGKSSVLDSILAVLGGGAAAKGTKKPIRDGEDHARVMLDLGDLTVTRTWKGDNTELKVASKDGKKYSSPQTVIEGFMGRFSFDPLEFTKLSPSEQVAALLELVDLSINLEELAQKRLGLYDARTEIGRTVKSLRGQLDGLGEMEDAPETEVSALDLIGRIRVAEDEKRARRDLWDRHSAAASGVGDLERQLASAQESLSWLDRQISVENDCEDVSALENKLSAVEVTNAAVRRNATWRETANKLMIEEERQHAHTDLIDEIDARKADALANAVFPVEGLSFGDEGVVFNGIPFSQASASEQIRVSLAMAMALNPRLRVIRILDGSLLDAENMAIITSMAEDQGFQIWIERVGDADGIGFIIEDGEVLL